MLDFDEDDAAYLCDDDQDDANDETGICPACSGSGEGMHEGTTCRSCKGKGEI